MSTGTAPAVKLAAIGDIAEVFPGFSTGTMLRHDVDGTHQVIMSRHLTPGLPYRYSAMDDFRIDPGRDVRKYTLRAMDLLFMSRGTRNVATWLESFPEPSIAPVSFFIVRTTDHVDPRYLTWYLNQPRAQQDIGEIRTGAGTPIVQRAAFERLKLPVPDLATQRTIADLGELLVRERQLLDRLAAATAHQSDTLNERLARDLFARAQEE